MSSDRAKEIVSQIIGTTCITSEKFNKGCEIIDQELKKARHSAISDAIVFVEDHKTVAGILMTLQQLQQQELND